MSCSACPLLLTQLSPRSKIANLKNMMSTKFLAKRPYSQCKHLGHKNNGVSVIVAPNGEGYLTMFFSLRNGHALIMFEIKRGSQDNGHQCSVSARPGVSSTKTLSCPS
uniref:uncharacterized protein LOC122593769 n=1 Tax=Erigeron canadensis TaxID=72917 RepID=UPI001CB94F14|nr:uncharacterized protein LOC122593769 [Erigeron canadensis]